MSENEMNPQPAGEQQPASDGDGSPTGTPQTSASPEPQGWRPPSESTPPAPAAPATPATPAAPVAPPASPWAPTSSASAPPADSTVPANPAPQYPTSPQYPTPQYPTSQYPANPYGLPPTTGAPVGPTTGAPAADGGYGATGPYTAGPGETPAATYPSAGYPTSSYPATGTQDVRRKRGVGMIATIGLLGLLLAAGGGAAGAAIMHSVDKNDTVTVNSAGQVVDNAPIIDRSSLASIASAVSPSVVSITTQQAEGSGVVLSTDGYILTNNHVAVTASGQSVDVTFSNGSSAKATLVGADAKTDLAVYKAQNVSNLTAAKFGNSGALQVGDTVLAIGSPLGLDGSVTAGIVSALNRTIDEAPEQQTDPQNPFGQGNSGQQSAAPAPTIAGAIQTDASINPGNSGGALVNTSGEVVGINTAIDTNGADGSIGVGFAIPSNRAKQVADDIIKGVKVSHPQLGVTVGDAQNNAGALIGQVTAGSAAAKAGIKSGDVITSFGGKAVHTQDDLLNDVQAGTVGTAYPVVVVRNGQNITVNVTLQEAK
ncbi:MAG TPA: trypsin-like peptidase domain-containing protein [Micromonosporaceae bacterium]|jgi:putative serine protease PepD